MGRIQAAKNMVRLSGVNDFILSMDHTELTPVGLTTSACDMVGKELGSSPTHAQVRPDDEAGNHSPLGEG